MWLDAFARTEIGCERDRNEDAFLVVDADSGKSCLLPEERRRPLRPPGTLLAVCDGMGGAAAGDVASFLALDALAKTVQQHAPIASLQAAEAALVAGVTQANEAIMEHVRQHPKKRGMGTTMTAALAMGPELVIVQVGDSRAYVRRGRAFEQLTMDQNVVGQMVAAGKLEADEARTFPGRNVLLEAVGVTQRFGPDIVRVVVQPGDVLLLCSDGLTGPLPDAELVAMIDRHEDPAQCARALTEAACALGGPDNITVVVAKIVAAQDDAPSDPALPIRYTRHSVLIGS